MKSILAGIRSVTAFLLILAWFLPLSLMQRLLVWPAVLLRPARRVHIVSRWMKFCSWTLLQLVRLGGGRWRIDHRIPTTEPIVIISNHQSLLDILVITLMGDPYVPAFVTRTRYGRFVPTVSLCVRMIGCPLVDPRDRRGSLKEMERRARSDHHGFIIFPEGHRSRDGELLPFKSAGSEVLLKTRPTPVWLVVTDGYWVCPTLADFIFRMHRIDGRTAVLGPFDPPAPDDAAAFVQRMRAEAEAQLRRMRASRIAA